MHNFQPFEGLFNETTYTLDLALTDTDQLFFSKFQTLRRAVERLQQTHQILTESPGNTHVSEIDI